MDYLKSTPYSKLIFTLYFISLFVIPNYAQAEDELQDKIQLCREFLRPYMRKVLGDEGTRQILGDPPESILLPPIPQIENDATSVKVYQKNLDAYPALNSMKVQERERSNYLFLKDLYMAVFNEEVSEEDLMKWLNVLGQGGSREGVYRSLVLGERFVQLENAQETVNDKTAKFTLGFMKRFLNFTPKGDALFRLNIFSVKRICVEKALEVLDVLSEVPDDLYDWYAVFSADLAQSYGKIWKDSLRQNVARKSHRQWAEKVPLEIIKSEVIIKLHMVYNALI